MPLLQRALSPFVDVRKEETTGALLMFLYAFLAMTAYNIIQPLTRSKVISSLGAVNLPWIILAQGFILAFVMIGYTRAVAALPRRWALPITQIVMAAVMVGFWTLFRGGGDWVSVAFYIWGALLGILLISQFWTLANGVYDPRQAKRLFGFVGGGVMLGGMTGAGLTAALVQRLGTNTLLLCSAATLIICAAVVSAIIRNAEEAAAAAASVDEERGVSISRAFALLRDSRQIQLIAIVIAFGSFGAALLDQQLSMATEEVKGRGETDAIGAFLAQVRFWLSAVAFVIQVWITPRIHKYLGIGFALIILPTNLGLTAMIMLANAVLWAPAVASVTDRSFRYTVDKTTREVLFLPLPSALRQEVKPFVDVTVDRFSRALGAILILVMIQPWGLSLRWTQLSFISLVLTVIWYFMAFRAKREYLASFRRSLESRAVEPRDVRLNVADLATVETLVQELAHPEPARVVYAIDVLESLDKRNLVTPLLLYHEAPDVRRRALRALGAAGDAARQWTPQIRRALGDSEPAVRTAALRALASLGDEDAIAQARPLLRDSDPRIRTTAALALATSADERDLTEAHNTLVAVLAESSDATRGAWRHIASALGELPDERFRRLLIPLLYDADPEIADRAMQSVRKVGSADFLFVAPLISLLRNRQVKGAARQTLVGYGREVIDVLAHFMRDPDEDIWLRRHIPTTIASIGTQRAVDVLTAGLDDPDGFLRYKIVAALERLRHADASLTFDRTKIEPLVLREARRHLSTLSLHHNLYDSGGLPATDLLALALQQKLQRTKDRIYRLLSLIYPWKDIAAAQWTIANGEPRARASASEYLDNLLSGDLRKVAVPVLEEMPLDERVRRANVIQRTRPRNVEETLLELINDDDQVIAAVAIDVVRQRRLWALADDIEHVLAHRDVRDWYVFEEASWALAEQRMPAERRRELWLEPLPAAVLADRLRELSLFKWVSVDELFRIASAARQVRHEPGDTLTTEGAVGDAVYLLLDGRVVASSAQSDPETIVAPAPLGFVEALEGAPMRRSIRTSGIAVTLTLTTDELRSLLADNSELVRGLFAEVAGRVEGTECDPLEATGAAGDLERLAKDGIEAVEKVLALQRVPSFSKLSAEEILQLATIAQSTKVTAGSALFEASSPPAAWLLLSGQVRLERPGGETLTARAGDMIGSFCALAGREIGMLATVIQDGYALRIAADDLFELLGERPDLLRQLFAGLSRSEQRGAISEKRSAKSGSAV